jgi:hypothetical protein
MQTAVDAPVIVRIGRANMIGPFSGERVARHISQRRSFIAHCNA